jgi:hypothetical protein
MSDPQRPEREAIEQALTDQLIIDAIAEAEPEYRGAGMWLALPKDLVKARRVLTDALLAALPPTPTPGWQDISTAPKDGTFILIYPSSCWVEDVEHDYEVSYWDEDFGRWHFSALPDDYTGPTHWMPLPPAPTGDRS